MDLPQYIQKLNPSAALMSDRVPNVELTGINNLAKTLTATLDDTKKYAEETSINNAKKDYELWLTEARQEFANNATLDNITQLSDNFNSQANLKIDECLRKNRVPWARFKTESSKMHTLYEPHNLQYSIQIATGVKAKAFDDSKVDWENRVGQIFTSATRAQLQGANGVVLLKQVLQGNEERIDQAISAGMLPASARTSALTQANIQTTDMFMGRLLKEAPDAAYDFVTRNSDLVEKARIKLLKQTGQTNKYQTIYSDKQQEFSAYQQILSNLDKATKQRLLVGEIEINKHKIQGSYQYDLGALYKDSQKYGFDFTDAIKDEELLRQYTTPYATHFTTDSIHYNAQTADLAGEYRKGIFVPANCRKGTMYYNDAFDYLSLSTIDNISKAYATYKAMDQKAAKTENSLFLAQEEYKYKKQIANDNLYTEPPTQITKEELQETANLRQIANKFTPQVGQELGINLKITSRYRPKTAQNYKSYHSEGRALDISMSEHSLETQIKIVESYLNNPLVQAIGTSNKEILNHFKNSAHKTKLKDESEFDKRHRTNHLNHIHITVK